MTDENTDANTEAFAERLDELLAPGHEFGQAIKAAIDSDPTILGWHGRTAQAGGVLIELEVETGGPETTTVTITGDTPAEVLGRLNELLLTRTRGKQGGEPLPEREPGKPAPELDAQQYAMARQSVLELAAALGSIPLEYIEGLVKAAQEAHDVTEAALVLKGLTREEAERSRRQLGIELKVFRPALAWRRSLDVAAEEARGAMAGNGVVIATANDMAAAAAAAAAKGNGAKRPPPPPPRKGGRR